MTRYSFAPVDELVPPMERGQPGAPPEATGLAERLGVRSGQIQRWRERGLDTYTADRIAVTLGKHPFELWPSWFDDAMNERCPWCGDVIQVSGHRTDRRSCSDKCAHSLRREADNVNGLGSIECRRRTWWGRLNQYRRTVDIPVENVTA